jgi:hypothetical protein
MFVDELSTRRLSPDGATDDEQCCFARGSLQEALIHLWLTETRRLARRVVGICRGTNICFITWRPARSNDSQTALADRNPATSLLIEMAFLRIDSGNSGSTGSARGDIISVLTPQLQPHERDVLDCFADGLVPVRSAAN